MCISALQESLCSFDFVNQKTQIDKDKDKHKDKGKNQCIRQKTRAQNIVKEIKQYQKKWLQHVQRMDTDYQNKHYNINQKDEGT